MLHSGSRNIGKELAEIHMARAKKLTRKGAIRAGWGELGIIPGSMGTCSYIVRGLGCAESFESASHGCRSRDEGEALPARRLRLSKISI